MQSGEAQGNIGNRIIMENDNMCRVVRCKHTATQIFHERHIICLKLVIFMGKSNICTNTEAPFYFEAHSPRDIYV